MRPLNLLERAVTALERYAEACERAASAQEITAKNTADMAAYYRKMLELYPAQKEVSP